MSISHHLALIVTRNLFFLSLIITHKLRNIGTPKRPKVKLHHMYTASTHKSQILLFSLYDRNI